MLRCLNRSMPQFIHLADERNISLMRKNGITAVKVCGCGVKSFLGTPVTENFYRSHHWLRELKRTGVRTISAVQVRIDDGTEVSIGRHNEDHITATAVSVGAPLKHSLKEKQSP